jgi:glycyl-tRNA synthetase beta chain
MIFSTGVLFRAGEGPTGARDPLALRRQAQGVVKILADLPALTGLEATVPLGPLLERAAEPFGGLTAESRALLLSFMTDRLAYLLEQRGFDVRSVRAVTAAGIARVSPLEARLKLEALAQMSGSDALLGVAGLLKRVKNITKGIAATSEAPDALSARLAALLKEPEEQALNAAVRERGPAIAAAAARGEYREAFTIIGTLQPAVATFFDKVLVMAEDEQVRSARLALVAALRDLILEIADISEIATE